MSVLTIQADTDKSYAIPILDADGNPQDMTGWSARAQVRANKWFRDLPVLFEWNTSLDSPNATLTEGQLLLKVTPEDSAEWTWWAGDCDIELVDPSGRVARLMPYEIVVVPAVTHD